MSASQLTLLGLASCVALYAALVLALVSAGRRADARALAGFVPDCVVLFPRLVRDPSVSRPRKLLLVRSLVQGGSRSHDGAARRSCRRRRGPPIECGRRPRRPLDSPAGGDGVRGPDASRSERQLERFAVLGRVLRLRAEHQAQGVNHVLSRLGAGASLTHRSRHLLHLRDESAVLALLVKNRESQRVAHRPDGRGRIGRLPLNRTERLLKPVAALVARGSRTAWPSRLAGILLHQPLCSRYRKQEQPERHATASASGHSYA